MILRSPHLNLLLAAAMLVFAACGPATVQSSSPAATRIPQPVQRVFFSAVDAYGKGDYTRAVNLTDSLLRIAAPTDSQMSYLGAYYGIRSRQALKVPGGDIGKYFETLSHLIPQSQRDELGYLVRGAAAPAPSEKQTGPAVAYKIGIILPLSGQFYEFGEAILEGAKLAVEEYNKQAGTSHPVELDVRDDAGEPVRAASLGRALAADSTVAALVGSHGNEATLSLALVSASQSIPLVCPTADDPGLDAIGNTIHVLNRTDRKLSASVADAAVEMYGLHTFAVMAEDDERGDMLADGFIEQVRADGGTVVADLRYPPETNNFENQMALIQRYLPDGIYLTAKSDMITQLASQVHYYGMRDVQLIGGEYWDSERVIRLGGDYVDGGLFSSPFYKDSERLRWQQFKEMYESSHRRPVNRFSAYGYDAVGIILAAMDKVPISRRQLELNLRSGREYDGATGIYTIGRDGRMERKYFVLRLAAGNIVPAQPPPQPDEGGQGQPGPVQEETVPGKSPN